MDRERKWESDLREGRCIYRKRGGLTVEESAGAAESSGRAGEAAPPWSPLLTSSPHTITSAERERPKYVRGEEIRERRRNT
jgi:hypothetical protein